MEFVQSYTLYYEEKEKIYNYLKDYLNPNIKLGSGKYKRGIVEFEIIFEDKKYMIEYADADGNGYGAFYLCQNDKDLLETIYDINDINKFFMYLNLESKFNELDLEPLERFRNSLDDLYSEFDESYKFLSDSSINDIQSKIKEVNNILDDIGGFVKIILD